mgnify:CR=1 FL=1
MFSSRIASRRLPSSLALQPDEKCPCSDSSSSRDDQFYQELFQKLINLLNQAIPVQEEIFQLTDQFLAQIVDQDGGDLQGRRSLTRAILVALGPQTRRIYFSQLADSGKLISLILDLLQPRDEQEARWRSRYPIPQFIRKVFGEGMLTDILFVDDVYTGPVSPSVRAWIDQNIRASLAEKPTWIIPSKIDQFVADPKNWLVGSDNELGKRYNKIITRCRDAITYSETNEDEDYGDGEDYYQNGSMDDFEEERNFLDIFRYRPKRGLRLNLSNSDQLLPLEPNQVFGPLNSYPDDECDGPKLDGCRMLTCMCHLSEFWKDGDDWFKGYCQICNNMIRNKAWALRYPEEEGGWRGVFCSPECLRLDDGAKSEQVEFVLDQLKEDGILDRI